MRKTTSAVDRLERELASEGVKLPRSRLQQIVANVTGCRNDNEFVARSAVLYPPARRTGIVRRADGPDLHVLADPRTGREYAVDARALAQDLPRADLISPCPYGGMVDVEEARIAEEPTHVDGDPSLPLFSFHLTRATTETASVSLHAATIEDAFERALSREFWEDHRNATFYQDDGNSPDRPYIPDEDDYEMVTSDDE